LDNAKKIFYGASIFWEGSLATRIMQNNPQNTIQNEGKLENFRRKSTKSHEAMLKMLSQMKGNVQTFAGNSNISKNRPKAPSKMMI
jgi:hypothetical protein